jgi:predicted lactoylglutathione lyase
MKFISLQPFVPSGKEFEKSKQLFQALGFKINWDAGDYVGFQRDDCKFILQNFYAKDFAENFMITVNVDSAEEFRKEVIDKKIPEKFGIRIGEVTNQPYGREVNIIDIAGVCWHFVQPQ